MENCNDDNYEDETGWTHFEDLTVGHHAVDYGTGFNRQTFPQRVILHFDLDCFYAQVEMIRNPALRNVPLGIQQKYLIVTCNYLARDQGVTKLMSVTDAKEKCPHLVLVKGEDLTHYREMSYKVTELLMAYCPLVERLGFDENFMDITEMVEKRFTQMRESHCGSFEGHVYNHSDGDAKARDHQWLALGSHIAAELRTAIHGKLGLTGCAGIATNKILAKLVSGTFKPNQQTTLLPKDVGHIMGQLGGLRRVPGIGHQTGTRLKALGLVSVQDLQLFPLADLVREFGGPNAQCLKNLSMGIDNSLVTPTGAPQSLSDEDSFKKISSTKEVLQKAQDLLSSLVKRMHKDGRQPQTFRLTVRRYSADNKWFSRESRQCPIPSHTGQKIISGSSDALTQLVPMAMKLFHKMVDSTVAFHLTLLNVCFTNLRSRGTTATGKGAITSFLTHSTCPRKTHISSPNQEEVASSVPGHFSGHGFGCEMEKSSMQRMITQDNFQMTTPAENTTGARTALHGLAATKSLVVSLVSLDLQGVTCSMEELESGFMSTGPNSSSDSHQLKGRGHHSSAKMATIDDQKPSGTSMVPVKAVAEAQHRRKNCSTGGQSQPLPSGCDFPVDVDPNVFSELPPDVQRELMAAWKQQKHVLKAPSSMQPGRKSFSKDKKAANKGTKQNDLYKYFKPS